MEEINQERRFSLLLLFASVVALLFLSASYFVEVRIIVERPRLGDVTGSIQTLWRAVLGVTTIGSFVIGVYTLRKTDSSSSGLPRSIEIKGVGHDIDVYSNRPVNERDAEPTNKPVADADTEDETTSTSDEGFESNTAGKE